MTEALVSASVLFATAANTLNDALTADLDHDERSVRAVFGLLLGGIAVSWAPVRRLLQPAGAATPR